MGRSEGSSPPQGACQWTVDSRSQGEPRSEARIGEKLCQPTAEKGLNRETEYAMEKGEVGLQEAQISQSHQKKPVNNQSKHNHNTEK